VPADLEKHVLRAFLGEGPVLQHYHCDPEHFLLIEVQQPLQSLFVPALLEQAADIVLAVSRNVLATFLHSDPNTREEWRRLHGPLPRGGCNPAGVRRVYSSGG
jgi:hypothetical protein